MIVDRCLDIDEFIAFHEKYATKDIARADDILDNWDYHFCFYDEVTGELLGCIYLEDEDGKVMLSGFTKPKNYDNIIVDVIIDNNENLKSIDFKLPFDLNDDITTVLKKLNNYNCN